MRNQGLSNWLLTIGAALALAAPAHARNDPPVITPTFTFRELLAFSNTEGGDDASSDEEQATSNDNGPFVRTVASSAFGDMGSAASGNARIKSTVTTFKIQAEGEGSGFAHTSSSEGESDHTSVISFTLFFTIPVDATCSVIGSIRAAGSGPVQPVFGGRSDVHFNLQGSAPDGFPFVVDESVQSTVSDEPLNFVFVQDVKANTSVVLTFSAAAGAANDGSGTATAEYDFNFTIDFGDEDADGLLDAWETDGIDLDGDGTPEIDLPAMGADPEKKNIFVELDSISGIAVDQNAIAMVEQAFAAAPGSMVDNPDGSNGIILHVMVDESSLTNEAYDGNAWPPEFDNAKAIHFGTPSLRSDPTKWNELKKVYKLIFRYCIWGDCIFYNREGDGQAVDFSGKGELPGNDFFVAGGAVASWFTDVTLRRNALAATFMHELGHTLNLHHGGQEDSPNYKPNYISVMNYAYQLPKTQTTVEGTAVADAWYLDYARTKPRNINELNVHEDQGLDGPAGRQIIFNTSANGLDPELQIADADASEIDFNLSGPPIETGITTVDLTRFRGTGDSYQATLEAFTDWDRIWYHLSGSSDFADGSHGSAAVIEPFGFDDFEIQNTYVVHDRSTPDCQADLNGDGIVDFGDINVFIPLFVAQDLAVDLNGDGLVDFGDINEYLVLFFAGC